MQFSHIINIGKKEISGLSQTFVIAEAGVNHNGDINLAKEMIDAASGAGADAVKFQTFQTDQLILRDVEKAPYQKKTTDRGESQYEMLKRLELSKEQTAELMDACKKKILFFFLRLLKKTVWMSWIRWGFLHLRLRRPI